LKILQVIPYFPPAYAFGGPCIGAYIISRELVSRGHEVVVFTTDARDTSQKLHIPSMERIEGITVYRFKNVSMFFVKNSKLFITPALPLKIRKVIKTFDVIHLHEYRTFQNIVVAHYSNKYNIPYVLQANGSLTYLGRYRRKKLFDVLCGYKILKNASKLIALSNFELRQYQNMGISNEKITIIPSAFDFSEYVNLPPRGRFRIKYGISDDAKIILYVGRIHRIKGLDILIKAFAYLLNQQELKNNILLVIVGPDDGFLGQVKTLIKQLNIDDKVLLIGPLYGKLKLEAYVDSDLFVLPSRYELLSRSLREACACGKPVIASRVGGLMDLVMEGVTGLLFKPGDVTELAKSIFLLLDNWEKAEDMGLKGRQFVKENFSIEKVVEKLEKVYEEIVVG